MATQLAVTGGFTVTVQLSVPVLLLLQPSVIVTE
jgi:hypothetical protein